MFFNCRVCCFLLLLYIIAWWINSCTFSTPAAAVIACILQPCISWLLVAIVHCETSQKNFTLTRGTVGLQILSFIINVIRYRSLLALLKLKQKTVHSAAAKVREKQTLLEPPRTFDGGAIIPHAVHTSVYRAGVAADALSCRCWQWMTNIHAIAFNCRLTTSFVHTLSNSPRL